MYLVNVFQSTILYVTALVNIHDFRNILFFGADFVYDNITDAKLHRVLDRRANQYIIDTVKLLLAIVTFAILFCAMPVYELLFNGKRILLINLILPFVDPDTVKGYVFNTLNLGMIAIISIAGHVGMEVAHLNIVNNLKSGVDLFIYNLMEFDDAVQKETGELTIKMKWQLRNIFMQFQDLDK